MTNLDHLETSNYVPKLPVTIGTEKNRDIDEKREREMILLSHVCLHLCMSKLVAHSSNRLVLQQGIRNRSAPTLHNNSQHSGEKFINWMERQKEITLHEISPLKWPGKTTFRSYAISMQRALFGASCLRGQEAVFNLFSITKKKSLLFSFYPLMVPSERPSALQIMGNESLSASGVDVSHDVEQKALLSLRFHMNILEIAERPAEKMSAE